MEIIEVTCRRCHSKLLVAKCPDCGRNFVLTVSHLRHQARKYEDDPATSSQTPDDFSCSCDYCSEREKGRFGEAVLAAYGQQTCPVCDNEISLPSGL